MPPGKGPLWSTVLLLGLLNSPAWALEPGQIGASQENIETPSLEFLEFLGDWETDDGEWIDPEELEQMVITDQDQQNEDAEQK
jgi:hypothetical protein